MGSFMTQHTGQLRLVVEQSQQARFYVDGTVGAMRMRWLRGVTQNEKAEGDFVGDGAAANHAIAHGIDVGLNAGIVQDQAFRLQSAVDCIGLIEKF